MYIINTQHSFPSQSANSVPYSATCRDASWKSFGAKSRCAQCRTHKLQTVTMRVCYTVRTNQQQPFITLCIQSVISACEAVWSSSHSSMWRITLTVHRADLETFFWDSNPISNSYLPANCSLHHRHTQTHNNYTAL